MESKLEKEFGWEKLMNFNIQIGKFVGARPEITHQIADKDGNYCIEFHSKKDLSSFTLRDKSSKS